VKKCREACKKVAPGEITLATEQLNTNEVGGGVGGVNGKKALVTVYWQIFSFQAKKLFVHQT